MSKHSSLLFPSARYPGSVPCSVSGFGSSVSRRCRISHAWSSACSRRPSALLAATWQPERGARATTGCVPTGPRSPSGWSGPSLETCRGSPAMIRELYTIAEGVSERLRTRGRRGRTITLKVRTPDFHTLTRCRTLPTPTDLSSEIAGVACFLLRELQSTRRERMSWMPAFDGIGPVRLLGISVGGLTDDAVPAVALPLREHGRWLGRLLPSGWRVAGRWRVSASQAALTSPRVQKPSSLAGRLAALVAAPVPARRRVRGGAALVRRDEGSLARETSLTRHAGRTMISHPRPVRPGGPRAASGQDEP